MLAGAFASWIEKIPERAFDSPFLDLLRAQGFYDIHFTHGAYEFGKDFIAKRDEPSPVQYAFQGKAGDIGGAAWMALYGQLLELASDGPAHPNFDATLPRKSVLVTTGRLTGKATIGPSQLRAYLNKAGHGSFEVWDIDVLKELLNGSVRFAISPDPALATILGHIAAGLPTERLLERELAQLIPPSNADLNQVRRSLVDNSLVVAQLVNRKLPFLALHAALNGVRIGAVRSHTNRNEGSELLHHALASYTSLGLDLLSPLLSVPDSHEAWVRWVGGPWAIAAYPVACAKVLEFLGLAALHLENRGQLNEARNLAEIAARVVREQPGACHPISDRMAASYPPALTALVRLGFREEANQLVCDTTKWLCDRYEESPFGLAGPYSDATDEIRTLLGAPFDFIPLRERRESLLAVALADASYTLALADYAAIVNDLLAVSIVPTAVYPEDDAAAYVVGTGATRALVNIHYPDDLDPSSLPHHALQPHARPPEVAGGPAALFALACMTRDRLFGDVMQRLRSAPPASYSAPFAQHCGL